VHFEPKATAVDLIFDSLRLF